MKILFTDTVIYPWAGDEVGAAYLRVIPAVKEMVRRLYEARDDRRTLVIVLMCPCCSEADYSPLKLENTVLVSAMNGIDPHRWRDRMHCVKKSPPFRDPGQGSEAATRAEYLQAVRDAIEEALKER